MGRAQTTSPDTSEQELQRRICTSVFCSLNSQAPVAGGSRSSLYPPGSDTTMGSDGAAGFASAMTEVIAIVDSPMKEAIATPTPAMPDLSEPG